MFHRVLASFLFCFGTTQSAQALDVPGFLDGKLYSTDVSQCGDIVGSDGKVLQLSREGIYAEQLSCHFIGFKMDADPQTGRVYSAVATANCSDDRGITRPDLISFSPDQENGQVLVQSQNEYLLARTEIMLAQKLDKAIPEASGFAFVSSTYKICN